MERFHGSIFGENRLQGAAKLALLSTGIIAAVIWFKVAIIPFTFDLILSTIPSLWISLRPWLCPPYIYMIVNFIIIVVATLPNNAKEASPTMRQLLSKEKTQNNDFNDLWEGEDAIQEDEKQVKPTNPSEESILSVDFATQNVYSDYLCRDESEEPINADMSTTAEDTLEETWKMITEGQGKTTARQLKKSETWDTPPRPPADGDGGDDDDAVAWARRELRKSDTFSDRVSLKREKSMSQDELNRRADEFISKFNNDMRLQRQQSHQRYMAMVNGGAA